MSSQCLPRFLSVPLVVATAALLVSCDADEDPIGPVDPSVTITSPTSGLSLFEGSALQLSGSATDPQDGALPDENLVWASSIDGDLGSGSSLEVSSPSLGIHTISLTAMNLDGNVGRAFVSFAIEELEIHTYRSN